jgi:hypothetical protein
MYSFLKFNCHVISKAATELVLQSQRPMSAVSKCHRTGPWRTVYWMLHRTKLSFTGFICFWEQEPKMRTALFWVITQRIVVIYYRRFGTTYRTHPQGSRIHSWTLRMGPIGYPERSVRNYHYSLRYNPEERSSQLLRGGRLKSRKNQSSSYVTTVVMFLTIHF